MSDFFGGLSGIRKPEVVMNSGPLPPLDTGGLPYGLNGTTDARINYNSTLLGNLDPYSYGGPSRLATQSSYLNIPHRVQKIVPLLYLPPIDMHSTHLVSVSHAVDYGDIAFSLRLRNVSTTLNMHQKSVEGSNDNGTNITAFINLATANYILLGMQAVVYEHLTNGTPANAILWMRLYCDITGRQYGSVDDWIFDLNRNIQGPQRVNLVGLEDEASIVNSLLHTLFHAIVPFGNAIGSEKQGGQHEATFGPVMMPVNYVKTMVVDGLTRDMVNFWRHMEVNSGDRLCLRLMPHRVASGHTCALNHYYKQIVTKEYNYDINRSIFLLTPDAYPYRLAWDTFSDMRNDDIAEPRGFVYSLPRWHIGQCQQHYPKSHTEPEMRHFLDDRLFQGVGGLLQMTLSPIIRHNFREYGEMVNFFNTMMQQAQRAKNIGETGLKKFAVEGEAEQAAGSKRSYGGDLSSKRRISFFDIVDAVEARNPTGSMAATGAATGAATEAEPEAASMSASMSASMADDRLDVIREMTESISNHPTNQTTQQQLKSKPKPISKKPTGTNKARANVVGLEENIDVDVV
jgi:hypothetical protein